MSEELFDVVAKGDIKEVRRLIASGIARPGDRLNDYYFPGWIRCYDVAPVHVAC